jgi:hypothetical protein
LTRGLFYLLVRTGAPGDRAAQREDRSEAEAADADESLDLCLGNQWAVLDSNQ